MSCYSQGRINLSHVIWSRGLGQIKLRGHKVLFTGHVSPFIMLINILQHFRKNVYMWRLTLALLSTEDSIKLYDLIWSCVQSIGKSIRAIKPLKYGNMVNILIVMIESSFIHSSLLCVIFTLSLLHGMLKPRWPKRSTCSSVGPKWGRKWKKWGKWNSCPPGTVRLATALSTWYQWNLAKHGKYWLCRTDIKRQGVDSDEH